MADRLIQTGTLTDIADAIRAKTGKSATMTPLEMPSEIASISGGGAQFVVTETEFTNTTESRVVTHNANLEFDVDSFLMIVEPTEETLALINDVNNSTLYLAKLIVMSKFLPFDMISHGRVTTVDFQTVYGSATRGSVGNASSFAYAGYIARGTDKNQIQYTSSVSAYIYPNSPYKVTIIQWEGN